MKNNLGFTLIELMIVVAIMGIIAAIAYPSYQEYVKKTKRTETEAIMMEIAQKLQSYKLVNGDYGANNPTSAYAVNPLTNPVIYGSTVVPRNGTSLYNLTITVSPTMSWVITATPITTSTQKGDGHLVLNHRNERCWTKGSDQTGTACTPSAATNWDGK